MDFLNEKLISREKLFSKIFKIKKGDKDVYEKIIDFLEKEGYRRTDFIEYEGDFSIRGSVVDIFSLKPFRIFFDLDVVERIKTIDVETQKTEKDLEEVEILSRKIEEEGETGILENIKDCIVVRRGEKFEFEKEILLSNSNYDFNFNVLLLPSFRGNIDFLFRELQQFLNQNYQGFVFVQEEKDIPAIREILEARDIRAYFFNYKAGFFSQSFVSNYFKFFSITDRDILGIRLPKRKIKRVLRKIDFEEEEFKEGDFVVHEEYGIGVYRGMKVFEIDGRRIDYFVIEYAGGDKLYVPVEDVSFIKKYTGFSETPPEIYPLKGNLWKNVKKKIEEKIDEFVIELLETEAKRKIVRGISFKEVEEEKIFAMEFPYEETEDQKKAIEEVLKLMEEPYPMEHLVCGDVGFGKTEVAMRASFRACFNGFQVIFLCPTTILAEQHYINFKERFKNFPVNIRMVSRLVSELELKRIVREVATGSADIVIGTHILLSEKFNFKNLGLLIIDEEHRFGINAKEKIKKKYPYIDVLYLSATPIPRTLAMALEGIKTFSLINTAPAGRKPVRIYIKNYDLELIKEAINRELLRGGQVFYIHNDISSIEEEKEKIKNLFNDISIEFIHGRLPVKKIEEIMLKFFKGEIKILVSTTIVESGLDIPNVNTLIVNNAHEFGLAQIYQLRGRVGRSDVVAYCFFLYPENKKLSEKAIKRIEAILNYSELGSGFSLAMRDLEIRGPGNFLTKKQHGIVKKVGIDLYLKLLKESIEKFSKKEEIKIPVSKVELSGFSDYYIPENFIENIHERLLYYRKIAETENLESLGRIKEEVEDKYGKIPDEFENLFEVQYLRILGARKEVEKITKRDKDFVVSMKGNNLIFKDKNSLIYFLKNI